MSWIKSLVMAWTLLGAGLAAYIGMHGTAIGGAVVMVIIIVAAFAVWKMFAFERPIMSEVALSLVFFTLMAGLVLGIGSMERNFEENRTGRIKFLSHASGVCFAYLSEGFGRGKTIGLATVPCDLPVRYSLPPE